MSDTANRRSSPERASQRKRAPQRGGRRAAEMARRRSEAIAPPSAPDGDVPAEVIAAPRARWSALRTPLRTITLSREAELAYIRADMRRLFIIAGLLLILMMVILVIVER